MIVKGCRSYVDLRNYEARVYPTFREACAARGLLGDDNEWYIAFDEAVVWGFGHRLRHLFVTMLIHCTVKDEMNFFERYWESMADDIKHGLRSALNNKSYDPPVSRLRDILLDELAELFVKRGSNISKFNLPPRISDTGLFIENRLIHEELSYDAPALAKEAVVLLQNLNVDQIVAYKAILQCVQAK